MEKHILEKIKDIITRIEEVNNQTKNKIDVLRGILVEYNELSEQNNHFNGYSVTEQIRDVDLAKNARKNVGKSYIHKEFLRIKELALFRIRHTYSLL